MKQEEFRNPGKEYRPSPFWSWNDELSPKELRWQVSQMAEQGFGGYFMHSRVGLATTYLSEEWMDCIRACLEEGKEVDTESWLYDEDKWPSGFAGGIVPAKGDMYRAKALVIEEISPEEVSKLTDVDNLIGVFAVDMPESGEMESYREIDAESQISDTERVFVFKKRIQPRSNWYNGESYVDFLNPKVTEEFLDITIDAYVKEFQEDFGEFIPGIFTDEPQYYTSGNLPWTDEMPQYFQEQNGYDLLNKLPLLFFEGEGCQKTRYDFWRTVTQKFLESFSMPYFNRCEKHGLKLTGHYMSEDSLLSQIGAIGAAMPHYEYQQCPGIDHLGRNIDNPLTLKQCSSAAHQFGRDRILCEIFGVSGHSMSFEDQKWIADFHFALGITFLCQHLTLYTMKGDSKRDYPPTISYHQPYWESYKLANDYFARASYICSQGEFNADLLVLHSISSAWATYAPGFEGRRNVQASSYNNGLTTLLEDLLAIHRGFDFGDEMILSRHAKIAGKEFAVKEQKYRAVVVPPSLTWNRRTFDLLSEFLDSDGSVVFVGETPTLIDGEEAASEWEKLLSHENTLKVDANQPAIEKTLNEIIPPEISVTEDNGNEVGDIYVHHRVLQDKHIYFLSSKSRTETYRAKVKLPVSGKVTEWHMNDGSASDVPVQLEDGNLVAELVFPPVGSHALVVDTSEEAVISEATNTSEPVETIKLEQKWEFSREHPNSLPLDFCQYAIGDDEWSEKMPVWKARKAAWKAAGVGEYDGIQPWVLIEKDIKPKKAVKFRLRTTFESETEGKNVLLVLESASDYTVLVNGKEVDTETDEWHWDKSFSKVDISSLVQKGENVIELSCQFNIDVQVEDMYLVGDFGVKKISGEKYVLTDEPQMLENGSWGGQGYPFYVGNIVYRQNFAIEEQPDKRATLQLKNPQGCLFRISVNDEEGLPLWYQPWEVDITDYLRPGENSVSIEVVSTLRNTFGPLHHTAGDDLHWVGPGQFVDEAHWTDEYQLVPYGFDEAQIVLY